MIKMEVAVVSEKAQRMTQLMLVCLYIWPTTVQAHIDIYASHTEGLVCGQLCQVSAASGMWAGSVAFFPAMHFHSFCVVLEPWLCFVYGLSIMAEFQQHGWLN